MLYHSSIELRTTPVFDRWLKRLRDRHAKAVITKRLERIGESGALGDVKSVGGGVSEIRVDLGPGYRIYFGREGATLVLLLCGGDKDSQDRDIAVAQRMWIDYRKERKP
jgi:putative addiction module killer protein